MQCVTWNEETSAHQKFEDCRKAIDDGNIEFLKEHAKEFLKSEYAYYNSGGETLFEKIVRKDKFEIAQIFIEAGIDVNCYTCKPPLYSALENGNDQMIDLLLNHDANPFECYYLDNFNQPTAFELAGEKNRFDVIEKFMKKYNSKDFKFFHDCPLSAAICNKKEDIAQFLIISDERGKFIKHIGSGDYNPMQEAIQAGMINIAKLLMNCGINLDHQGNKVVKETALHIAAQENNIIAIHDLIEHGANPDIKNNYKKLPEDLAKNEEIVLALKSARMVQELASSLSDDKKIATFFSLITSFPLLSFTIHHLPSKDDVALFYNNMNIDEKYVKIIAPLLDKETFKNETDFTY